MTDNAADLPGLARTVLAAYDLPPDVGIEPLGSGSICATAVRGCRGRCPRGPVG